MGRREPIQRLQRCVLIKLPPHRRRSKGRVRAESKYNVRRVVRAGCVALERVVRSVWVPWGPMSSNHP